jgi:hypothetical protein
MLYEDDEGISILLGKTISEILKLEDEIVFITYEGKKYKMFHNQDYDESVSIEDINGDLEDLLNSPITLAEETNNSKYEEIDDRNQRQTWHFYKLATI